jgi:hypothetical protein
MNASDEGSEKDERLPPELKETDALLRRSLASSPASVASSHAARDLSARVVAQASSLGQHTVRTRPLALTGLGALAAGLVLGVFATRTQPAPDGDARVQPVRIDDDGFRAKGHASDAQDVTLVTMRDGAPARITDRMRTSDAVLVAYTNAGRAPARALALFAVDARGEVFWLYPAYTDVARPPSSIPIDAGVSVELPDAVRHDFVAGGLRFVALFTLSPVSVIDIERWITDAAVRPFATAPVFAGAIVDVQDVTVVD